MFRRPGLYFRYFNRLRAFLSFLNLKLDCVAVVQRFEAIANNAGKVDKDVAARFSGDKTITL